MILNAVALLAALQNGPAAVPEKHGNGSKLCVAFTREAASLRERLGDYAMLMASADCASRSLKLIVSVPDEMLLPDPDLDQFRMAFEANKCADRAMLAVRAAGWSLGYALVYGTNGKVVDYPMTCDKRDGP